MNTLEAIEQDAATRHRLMTTGPDGGPQYARLARLWLARRFAESHDCYFWLAELGKLLVAAGKQWE